jgi:hypothetical protein
VAKNDSRAIAAALLKLAGGDWQGAHEIVQRRNDADACRVHALLHRMEGDAGNAAFWYRRAGLCMPQIDTQGELEMLLNEFSVD